MSWGRSPLAWQGGSSWWHHGRLWSHLPERIPLGVNGSTLGSVLTAARWKSWENPWEKDGLSRKAMGKPWKTRRKMGKRCENHGKMVGFYGIYPSWLFNIAVVFYANVPGTFIGIS